MPKRGWISAALALFLGSAAVAAPTALETDGLAYRLRFENKKVRVLDVKYKPGHKIAMHRFLDRLVFVQESGRLSLRNEQGIEKILDLRAGDVSWEEAGEFEIENVGSSEFRSTLVEIKA